MTFNNKRGQVQGVEETEPQGTIATESNEQRPRAATKMPNQNKRNKAIEVLQTESTGAIATESNEKQPRAEP